MYFAILGPLRVHDGDQEIVVSAPKQRALLAGVLMGAGRTQATGRLIDVLWGGDAPSGSREALHMQMARLRQTVGDRIASRILTRSGGYLIEVGSDELDINRFTDLYEHGLRVARKGNWEQAIHLLTDSLDLWSGNPLQDVPSERLHAEYVPHLTEMRLVAIESSIEARLNLGEHDTLVGELQELVGQHPLRERFAAQLMLALYRSSRQADALEAFRRLRSTLRDELAVEPMAALQHLHRRILNADPRLAAPDRSPRLADGIGAAGAAGTAPPAPVQHHSGSRRQLPADTRVFIGRSRHLDELIAPAHPASADSVTYVIDGLAGIGKTALAVHAGHRLRDRFPDGQLFLDLHGHTTGLAPLPSGEALHWLLCCLGVPVQLIPEDLAQRAALYRDRLAGTRTLLILDNAFSAAQVRPLLPGASGCMALITSRKRLAGLDDAYSITLGSLSEADAVALLREVAGPGRIPVQRSAAGELAAMCGYMPLALRIAAARLRHHKALRVEDLVQRLSDENTRLDHLQDGDRNLAAVFDSAYAALPEAGQRMLRTLGLLPGPDFDAYAAANLAEADLEAAERLLDSLTDHNLLTQHAVGRYRLHDLVRVYTRSLSARDPVEERDSALGRLLDYYQYTARACHRYLARRTLPGPAPAVPTLAAAPDIRDRAGALTWLRGERAGLLAAIAASAARGDSARVVSLTAALASFLDQDGSRQQAAALHQAAATAAHALKDRFGEADALLSLSRARETAGDYPAAVARCEQALAIYRELGDQLGEANALHVQGHILQLTNDYPASTARQAGALAAYRKLGDQLGKANALWELGRLRLMTSDAAAAADLASSALAIYRQLGNRLGEANTLWDLARARELAGGNPDAADLVANALVIYQELDYRIGEANALCVLGRFTSEAGNFADAADLTERGLAIHREIGSPLGEAGASRELAEIRLMLGDLECAAELLERALTLFRAIGNQLGEADSLHDLGRTRLAEADYPAADGLLRGALDLFRNLGVRLGEAEVLISTGHLTAQTTGLRAAADVYRRAASLAREVDIGWLEAQALESAARCEAEYGDLPASIADLHEVVAIYRRIGSAKAYEASAFLEALEGPTLRHIGLARVHQNGSVRPVGPG